MMPCNQVFVDLRQQQVRKQHLFVWTKSKQAFIFQLRIESLLYIVHSAVNAYSNETFSKTLLRLLGAFGEDWIPQIGLLA